jgi:hypothetical protein
LVDFSQEIRAIVLIWIIVDIIFLTAVLSAMTLRLFVGPREFTASIGKRLCPISTYSSQTGRLNFLFGFILNVYISFYLPYFALLKCIIISCDTALG